MTISLIDKIIGFYGSILSHVTHFSIDGDILVTHVHWGGKYYVSLSIDRKGEAEALLQTKMVKLSDLA